MYIKKIVLENIRCFEHIEIEFDLSGKNTPWTVVVGDNAVGKTTLLKSIAIGLCDESSAAGLLKESDTGYVRFGKPKGIITIDLQENNKRLQIKTEISHIDPRPNFFIEKVRQDTKPKKFPWNKLFVAGYGAGRGTSGTGDVSGYAPLNAVYNMFNYTEGLQNPELAIRRVKNVKMQNEIKGLLNSLLDVEKVDVPDSGITVDGKWGKKMPLRDLADGYKSTFLWITDLLGWAISFQPRVTKVKGIKGIVLVDEIEQHLHPKWQKDIIADLKAQFPKIQFITTTHSPLVASSFGTLQEDIDKRILLSLTNDGKVVKEELPPMIGWRVDQTLASEAFDHTVTGESDEVNMLLLEASELTCKKRSKKEEMRYNDIKQQLALARLSEQQTQAEEEIEKEITQYLMKEIERNKNKIFGVANDKNNSSRPASKKPFKKTAKKK